MDDMQAFEGQIAGVIRRVVGPPRRVDAMAVARNVSTRSSSGRFRSMLSATRLIVAGVIVAVFGGFLLTSSLHLDSNDRSLPGAAASGSATPGDPETSTVAPTGPAAPAESASSGRLDTAGGPTSVLPVELPDDAEAGVIETPYGPARWVRVIGDDTRVPQFDALLPGPTGLLAFDGFCSDRAPRCPRLWSADDILAPWTEVTLPDEATWSPADEDFGSAALTVQDGTYWLTVNYGTGNRTGEGTWRSTDAAAWQRIDLDALGSPDRGAFKVQSHSLLPVSFGGIDVIPIVDLIDRAQAASLLGLRGAFKAPRSAPHLSEDAPIELRATATPGTLSVFDGIGRPLGKVRVEETRSGVRVTRGGNGKVLANADGLDLADIERFLGWGGSMRLAIVEGDRLARVIEAPWDDEAADWPMVVSTADGFVAVVRNGTKAPSRWRSTDGQTWSPDGNLDLLVDEPASADCAIGWLHAPLAGQPGQRLGADVGCEGNGASAREMRWETDDTVSWTRLPGRPRSPGGEAGDAQRLATGWFSVDEPSDRWWFFADGEWVSVADMPAVAETPRRCENVDHMTRPYGDAIVSIRYTDPSRTCPRTIRVLEFEGGQR